MSFIIQATTEMVYTSAFVFNIKQTIFLDTLIQKISFLIIKISNLQGDLASISALKRPLVFTGVDVECARALAGWTVQSIVVGLWPVLPF